MQSRSQARGRDGNTFTAAVWQPRDVSYCTDRDTGYTDQPVRLVAVADSYTDTWIYHCGTHLKHDTMHPLEICVEIQAE